MERHRKPADRRAYLLETRGGYITSIDFPFCPRTRDPREAATVFGTERAREVALQVADKMGMTGSFVRPVTAGLRVQQYMAMERIDKARGDDGVTLFA